MNTLLKNSLKICSLTLLFLSSAVYVNAYSVIPTQYSYESDIITFQSPEGYNYLSYEADDTLANGGGPRACSVRGDCDLEQDDGWIFGTLGTFHILVVDSTRYNACTPEMTRNDCLNLGVGLLYDDYVIAFQSPEPQSTSTNVVITQTEPLITTDP